MRFLSELMAGTAPLYDGDGGGAGDGGGNLSGDGGAGAGAAAWKAPEGLPSEFVGNTADEVLAKLLPAYTETSTRANGLRDKLAKMPAAPDKPEAYTFTPGDKVKPYFPDVENNPGLNHARSVFHKHGISNDAFNGIINDMYGTMSDAGLLTAPFDPKAEITTYRDAFGMDEKAVVASFTENETFANGLAEQLVGRLNSVPDALKTDVKAQLLALTDTAAGNMLLRALSGRLAESGIRLAGEGAGQGQLTEADLRKLSSDPRIDPANRDNPDPAKRFDADLRKRYDDGYAKLPKRALDF